MLSRKHKQLLKKNWQFSDALHGVAVARFYDPKSTWECYIFAMNPDNEDEVKCLIRGFEVAIVDMELSYLKCLHNDEGASPEFDYTFVPCCVGAIYQKLRRVDELLE